MTQIYTSEQAIAAIAPLTAERLSHFEQLRIIAPVNTPDGPRYHVLDIRRITLLCELTDDFEVNEDALVIIMSLIDQLHGAHCKLEHVVRAIAQEPSETKVRLSQRLYDFATAE
jgi:chaperone modulatory protein CbpM